MAYLLADPVCHCLNQYPTDVKRMAYPSRNWLTPTFALYSISRSTNFKRIESIMKISQKCCYWWTIKYWSSWDTPWTLPLRDLVQTFGIDQCTPCRPTDEQVRSLFLSDKPRIDDSGPRAWLVCTGLEPDPWVDSGRSESRRLLRLRQVREILLGISVFQPSVIQLCLWNRVLFKLKNQQSLKFIKIQIHLVPIQFSSNFHSQKPLEK